MYCGGTPTPTGAKYSLQQPSAPPSLDSRTRTYWSAWKLNTFTNPTGSTGPVPLTPEPGKAVLVALEASAVLVAVAVPYPAVLIVNALLTGPPTASISPPYLPRILPFSRRAQLRRVSGSERLESRCEGR